MDYPFIAIVPRSTLARSGSTWKDPVLIKLFDILTECKQTIHAKLFEIEEYDHLTV